MQQTKRLTFRTLTMADHALVYRQFSDVDMCRFFNEPACSWDEAAGIITHYERPSPDMRYARWGIFRGDTGVFIGTCGYHYWDAEKKHVEIGYDIWKDSWNAGYATEAVQSLIDHVYTTLGVHTVYALIHPENTASQAVVRRHGFVQSPLLRACDDGPLVCYAQTRA